MMKVELASDSWQTIWRRSLVFTCISALLSLAVSEAILLLLSQGLDAAGAITALALPILIGGPAMFYMQVRSAQLADANRQLERLASTDWLTDCLNRRAFTARAEAALANAPRANNALLIIDADDFKTVNDRFGHNRGDEALQLIADAIRASIREGDLVGRLGGEEFGVFMSGADAIVGERIRKSINLLFVRSEGLAQRLSVSIGGMAVNTRISFAEMLEQADRQLYAAKNQGRNRVLMSGTGDVLPHAASA
jgi:diguanylate cyclase